MDGYVIFTNPEKNRAIIRTRSGKYTVLEVSGQFLLSLNDLISGQLDTQGKMNVINLTKRVMLSGYISLAGSHIASKAKERAL